MSDLYIKDRHGNYAGKITDKDPLAEWIVALFFICIFFFWLHHKWPSLTEYILTAIGVVIACIVVVVYWVCSAIHYVLSFLDNVLSS